jgi:hypothetical protein
LSLALASSMTGRPFNRVIKTPFARACDFGLEMSNTSEGTNPDRTQQGDPFVGKSAYLVNTLLQQSVLIM